jgi:hypothetical protein
MITGDDIQLSPHTAQIHNVIHDNQAIICCVNYNIIIIIIIVDTTITVGDRY